MVGFGSIGEHSIGEAPPEPDSGPSAFQPNAFQGFQGAAAVGQAGEIAARGGAEHLALLHKDLMSRVVALEASLRAIPAVIDQSEASSPTPIGMGHNGPPNFVPTNSEDLLQINQLIDLLKQDVQPVTTTLRSELVERGERVSAVGKKIREHAETFIKEATRSAGAEVGKRLVQLPFWLGIGALIDSVVRALSNWLAAVPLQ